MTRNLVKLESLAAALLVLLLAPAPAFAGEGFDRVVAFGDSLADPGNAFAVTGQIQHKPYPVVPGAPYPIGGLHFSNGETWVEQLARELGAEPSANPAFREPGVFTNYAFGGARARGEAGPGGSPTLTDQVALFLGDHGGVAPSDALYAISIGGNDLRDAAFADPGQAPAIIEAAVMAIAGNVQVLINKGARHFVIANQPNLSVVPAITLQGNPFLEVEALKASKGFNLALNDALDAIEKWAVLNGLDVRIARINAFELTDTLATDPGSLGFADGSTPCLTFGVIDDAVCTDRDGHFYWDGIHPTRAGHALIAQRALEALAAE